MQPQLCLQKGCQLWEGLQFLQSVTELHCGHMLSLCTHEIGMLMVGVV